MRRMGLETTNLKHQFQSVLGQIWNDVLIDSFDHRADFVLLLRVHGQENIDEHLDPRRFAFDLLLLLLLFQFT